MSRHVNIPVFIPHLGCPNQCVFCNQRTISGVEEFDKNSLTELIEQSLSTVSQDDEVEIAFFGGSFTGIDRQLMTELLDTAYEYIKSGRVSSIRCSTRPDYIDAEVLSILKSRGVKVIELGLQSASDKVLKAAKRGHTRECEIRACKMIVDGGFELVGQMMIGLPKSTRDDELETARLIIECGATGARIYPTVVFRGTELCDMAIDGSYEPLPLDEAVERSAAVFDLFLKNDVKIIRIGLCSSENLSSESTYHSGPNHPAIGELVLNRFYYDGIYREAKKLSLTRDDILYVAVAKGALSKAIGQKKRNKILLTEKLVLREICFLEDGSLGEHDFKVMKHLGEKECI